VGGLAARPTIMSVKKMLIESTCAEFWNVWFIAPPAPRSPAGCGAQPGHSDHAADVDLVACGRDARGDQARPPRGR